MYSKQKSISLKASASMVLNNLAVKLNADTGGADMLFLHKSVVHLLLSSGPDSSPDAYTQRHVVCQIPTANQQMSFVLILQADWVEVAGRKILVLATQKGIKMYEWDGSTLIYWHGFGASGESVLFTRGITSIGSNTICVGTSSGQLLVFSVPAKGGNITFEEYLSGHSNSITCVVARGDVLVSADDNGDIAIRKHMDGASFKLSHQISGEGSSCNCLDIWKNLIVAGYGDGQIKIFSVSNGALLGDIGAHSRSINALHIAQATGMCITASEDSFVRVWELHAGPTLEVSHLFSDSITNHQLVGAQFTDNDGRSFAVSAYDTSEVYRYNQS